RARDGPGRIVESRRDSFERRKRGAPRPRRGPPANRAHRIGALVSLRPSLLAVRPASSLDRGRFLSLAGTRPLLRIRRCAFVPQRRVGVSAWRRDYPDRTALDCDPSLGLTVLGRVLEESMTKPHANLRPVSGMDLPRYSGISTFMRLPILPLERAG